MENFIEIFKNLSSNWEGIAVAIAACAGATVKIFTILNAIMPKKITNEKLAKIEYITSKLSFGTKKAEIVKK